MRYKWLLFDADGTLFDYDRAEASALERAFVQAGYPFEPDYAAVYRRINQRIWLEFEQGQVSQQRLRTKRFEQLFDSLEIQADPGTFSTQYLAYLAEGDFLIDGAEDVVRALYRRAGLMIITNGLKEVQRSRLGRSSIGRYFAGVVISEEAGAAKPDEKIFDVAFQRMAAFQRMGSPRKEEVLIVGDSLTSDIKGGNNYGIDTCWFNPAQRPRDLNVGIEYEIRDLGELLRLV